MSNLTDCHFKPRPYLHINLVVEWDINHECQHKKYFNFGIIVSLYTGTSSKDVESDLDALRGSSSRVSKIQEKMCKSQDEFPTSPTSPPGGKTETMYKPSVNMEDAVKWPQEMPGKLDFRKMEVFEGRLVL